jgi:hypothetical protein
MTADGRIEMIDVIEMFGDELDLTPPKVCGRIVTGFNGLILGLESKSGGLENNMVYEIRSKGGVLNLKKKGKSRINFNTENRDISQILLMERSKLIITKMEEYQLDLDKELNDEGWFKIRDKYLKIVDNSELQSEELNMAEEKLKILQTMIPISKNPEKWV